MKKILFQIGLLIFISNLQAQIKVSPTGTVAIGSVGNTINSAVKLQVVGGVSIFTSTIGVPTCAAFIRGSNTYSTSTTPDYTWWNSDQTGIFHPSPSVIGFSSYGAERMRITSSNVVVSSYLYAYNFYTYSDEKYKKQIKTIPNPLNKVMQLRGVNYKLNFSDSLSTFNTNEQHMGVIAQEVEKVVPEVVKTSNDGTKAVAYQNLVGLLIEAIKEQQLQINELKKQFHTNSLKSSSKNNTAENLEYDTFAYLEQNLPNPFSQTTKIKFYIPDEVKAAYIYIYNMTGTQIKSIPLPQKGNSSIIINGSELQPGMYFYTLIADGKEIDTKKMILTN